MTYLYALSRLACAGPWPEAVDGSGGVTTLTVAPYLAVISEIDATPFVDDQAEARLRDLQWIGPRALRHEAVVRHVHGQGAAIPARFGTLFSSPAAIAQWVEANQAEIEPVFTRLNGADEWGITIQDTNPDVAMPWSSAGSKTGEESSPGRRYLVAALRKRNLETARADLRGRQESHLRQRLAGVARECMERRPGQWAYLVNRENCQMFARAAEEFSRPELGLRFGLNGPWPPYSFVREFSQGRGAGSFEATPAQGGRELRGQAASAVQA